MSSRLKTGRRLVAAGRCLCSPSRQSGDVLVYVILVMVIFAVIGVTMVSLFGTAGSGTATANEARRALLASESGIRYAMSELRNTGFTKAKISELNDTTYNLKPEGNFTLNVFGAWFESLTNQDVTTTGTIRVNTAEGRIPNQFFNRFGSAIPELHLLNYDYIGGIKPQASAVAAVSSYTSYTGVDTYFDVDVGDDFVVGKNEFVCMAFPPAAATNFVPTGGSSAYLNLKPEAKYVFPKTEGAFEFERRTFFYNGTEENAGYFRLKNITAKDGVVTLVSVADTDRVILSPMNYYLTANGTYGDVTYEFGLDKGAAIADRAGLKPGSRKPDIEFQEEANLDSVLAKVEPGSNPNFVTVDSTDKFLTIGGGGGPSLGSVWFRDTRNIGGIREFCNAQGCFFNRGFRAFFTLEYTGSGDGLIFALINGNGNKNDTASVGGDIEQSEMLGYSGDSRINTSGTLFLDNSGPERGLVPPKIGLEFDTKINYSSTLEQSLKYCSGSSLNADTRNDPGSNGKDAVQYVFWGNDSLDVPCRADNPSYDDNRHNAIGDGTQNWEFLTNQIIKSSPALAADGTIYIGSNDNRIYAINPDGTEKWNYGTGADVYSPTVSASGTIYVGSGNFLSSSGVLHAFNPNGSLKFGPFVTAGPVTTKPAIGTDGTVFIGSDDGNLYAINPSTGMQKWRFNTGSPVRSSPAISNSGNYVYFGSNSGTFFALRTDTGAVVWAATPFPTTAFTSSPAVGPDGTVYVGNDNGRLYAFNGSSGAQKWTTPFYPTAGVALQSSPALSSDGSVVYIGSFDDRLYAVNTSDGSEKWRFEGATSNIQGPIAVDANDHIYFGSDDNNVYALYFDGSLKWQYSTGGDVRGRPAVTADGTVYAGSFDFRLHAINQFANPKNYRDRLITYSAGSVGGVPVAVDNTDDWLKGSSGKGPWAVRMEVTRSLSRSGGTYAYTLKTWLRQCDQPNCSDVLGTFFEDTRIAYSPTSPVARPPQLEQTINLLEADHQDFERFIFGFTSQTATGDLQTATIRKFQLSFIRPGDTIVANDPNWP